MHVPHQLVHEERGEGVWEHISDIVAKANPFSDDGKTHENRGQAKALGNEKRATVIRTVYLTVDPDFEGDIGGYKTFLNERIDELPKTPLAAIHNKLELDDSRSDPAQPTALDAQDFVSVPPAISEPTISGPAGTKLAQASDIPTESEGLDLVSGGAPTVITTGRSLPSPTSDTESDGATSDSGTSAGVKAGIAFGVLGGVLIIGLLVYFIISRRRKQVQTRRDDDEKSNNSNPFVDSASDYGQSTTKSNPKAPRISLRPVTQFFPTFNNGADKALGNNVAMTLAPPAATDVPANRALTPSSIYERPTTSESLNPFGAYAERAPSPLSDSDDVPARSMPPSPMSTDSGPFADPIASNNTYGAAAGAGTGALARKTSLRRNGPARMDLTIGTPSNLGPIPPSPSGSEFSVSYASPDTPTTPSASAAAIAAAGGPTNSSVHRIQLDFKPTLEDELALRAGDLIRLLHEYDDGWALCIRLDRSAQGVVPRTCLSTRPVKPRPAQNGRQGPPIHPNGGPNGQQRGPNGQRPMTPQGMNGRTQSPGPRMQGPGGRPHSPAGINRHNSPPRLSPMNPMQSTHQEPPESPVSGWPLAY